MFQFTNRMKNLEYPKSFIDYDFNDYDILPRNINKFYEFNGSLTTPPYFEICTWIVYPDPLYISSKQVRNLKSERLKLNILPLNYYFIIHNYSFLVLSVKTISIDS